MTACFTSSFGLDPALEAEMRKMGHVMNLELVERSRALFAERKNFDLPPGAAMHKDLVYGDHPRQRLDICALPGSGHPVALFVPGGGFNGGDKGFYSHVPHFFARSGFVGAAVNYRLAPDFLFPSGAEDVSRALDWIAGNIQRYGGDPARLFVVAQSAGAVHAASALFDPALQPACLSSIQAAALMSGLYEIEADMDAPNANLYFGNDPTLCRQRSSSQYASRSKLPVLMTLAELEPPFFAVQAAALLRELGRRVGGAPPFAWLKGHNHLSPVLGMGGPGDQLGDAILAEFRRYG